MERISYVYSKGYTSNAAEELAHFLLSHSPGGLSKAIFGNFGGEATDAALKLPSQYRIERGQPRHTNSIPRYHGITLGALRVSDHASRRVFYAPWFSHNVSFVDPRRDNTIVKALGGGSVPLSGVLATRKVFEAVKKGSGILVHGHTSQAHPTACVAAVEVERIVTREILVDSVVQIGVLLEQKLKIQMKSLPFVINAARSLSLNILGNLGDCGEIHIEHAILSPPYFVNMEEMRENVTRLKVAVQLVDRVILGSKEPHEAGGERISEFRKDVAKLSDNL